LIDTDTDKPVPGALKQGRLSVGLYGPSRPKSGAACQSCPVDDQGRFRLHVAPGANYVYLMNSDYWRRMQQREFFEEGVEVKSGEVVKVVFRIQPTKPHPDDNPIPLRLQLPVPAERQVAINLRQPFSQ
jgi:hypothetical protein